MTPKLSFGRALGESHERVGIAISFPKTAALFLDRVWSLDEEIPHELQLRLRTPAEAVSRHIRDTMVEEVADAANANELIPLAMAQANEIDIAPKMEPLICSEYKKLTGRPLPAFLGSSAAFDKVYKPGDCEVLSAAILSIPIVDETCIDWEQVLEIRRDKESTIRLRRFFHWLDAEMISKPAPVVKDSICVKLDDYNSALKKHGVKTSLGAASVALSSPSVWGGAAASAMAGLGGTGKLFDAAAVGATVALGTLGVRYRIEKRLLSIKFAEEREKSEVGYVHEISERFSKANNG